MTDNVQDVNEGTWNDATKAKREEWLRLAECPTSWAGDSWDTLSDGTRIALEDLSLTEEEKEDVDQDDEDDETEA